MWPCETPRMGAANAPPLTHQRALKHSAPPPPYTLATNTEDEMKKMTTSVIMDINLITQEQPAHAQPAFDAIHEADPPSTFSPCP